MPCKLVAQFTHLHLRGKRIVFSKIKVLQTYRNVQLGYSFNNHNVNVASKSEAAMAITNGKYGEMKYRKPPMYGAKTEINMLIVCGMATHLALLDSGAEGPIIALIRDHVM